MQVSVNDKFIIPPGSLEELVDMFFRSTGQKTVYRIYDKIDMPYMSEDDHLLMTATVYPNDIVMTHRIHTAVHVKKENRNTVESTLALFLI
jgi:hypothetical protein